MIIDVFIYKCTFEYYALFLFTWSYVLHVYIYTLNFDVFDM